jgi:hypothetical protein
MEHVKHFFRAIADNDAMLFHDMVDLLIRKGAGQTPRDLGHRKNVRSIDFLLRACVE